MAEDVRMALEDLLGKLALDGELDVLREGVRVLAQALMELDVSQHLGAERHERARDNKSRHDASHRPVTPLARRGRGVQGLQPARHRVLNCATPRPYARWHSL
jgi:transposase-like protein